MLNKFKNLLLRTKTPKQDLLLDLQTNSLNGLCFGESQKKITKLLNPDRTIKYGNDTESLYYKSGLCLSFTQQKLESFMIFLQESNRSNAYKKMQYNNLAIKKNNKIFKLNNKTSKEQILDIFKNPFEKYISKEFNSETFLYIENNNQLIFKFNKEDFLTLTEYCIV